ncbi:MAG TPA: nuclear transport factor 2 family protein [Gemmatimonadales bacterium]|nr:nuclear transport factor 2 family protein [Gemmatimonadales bacterium]
MGAIVATNVTWGDALVRGDSAMLRSVYTAEAVLRTPEGDVQGGDAIVARLLANRRAIRDSVHATATNTDRLDVAGDRAYEAGTITYTVVSGNKSREVTARYFNFWQLAGGRWQLTLSFRPLP